MSLLERHGDVFAGKPEWNRWWFRSTLEPGPPGSNTLHDILRLDLCELELRGTRGA